MMARRIKIYFDGGCRPNPGRMETAVVTGGAAVVVRDAGIGSSMDAEWLALIAAMRLARDLELTNFILLGDAMTVVEQATGALPAKGEASDHLAAFQALVGDGPMPIVRHIKRTQNLAGIALARGR